jgi:hypothetical protein
MLNFEALSLRAWMRRFRSKDSGNDENRLHRSFLHSRAFAFYSWSTPIIWIMWRTTKENWWLKFSTWAAHRKGIVQHNKTNFSSTFKHWWHRATLIMTRITWSLTWLFKIWLRMRLRIPKLKLYILSVWDTWAPTELPLPAPTPLPPISPNRRELRRPTAWAGQAPPSIPGRRRPGLGPATRRHHLEGCATMIS